MCWKYPRFFSNKFKVIDRSICKKIYIFNRQLDMAGKYWKYPRYSKKLQLLLEFRSFIRYIRNKEMSKIKATRYIIPRVYFRFEAGSSNSGKLVSNISSTQINPSFTYDILILTNYQTGRDTMNS